MDKAEKIKEVLTRGVENIYPSSAVLEKVLQSNKKLKMYWGIDPTGKLHVGHGVALNKLRQFQELGHEVIILIGDFTAMVGDPTGKSGARKPLTRKEVLRNAKDYKKLIAKVLNLKKTKFDYNSRWLAKMKLADVIELMSHFTASRLLERDMFQQRLKTGHEVFAHELLYPALVGYDCVALNVDLELGGNDQTFNMLTGRTLMKKMKDKEKFVLATKLLVDPSGKKMGKTEGNMVNLDDTPEEMYGKVMSWPDNLIVTGFEIATTVPMDQVQRVVAGLAANDNPKSYKMQLAQAIVTIYHGEKAARHAEQQFAQVFNEGLNPDDITEIKIKAKNIIDVLVETKLAASKSEARRLIAQGAIRVDQHKLEDDTFILDSVDKDGIVIQKGKRHFVKIVK